MPMTTYWLIKRMREGTPTPVPPLIFEIIGVLAVYALLIVVAILIRREEDSTMRLLFHIIMTLVTGGLWLVVLLIRFLIRKD